MADNEAKKLIMPSKSEDFYGSYASFSRMLRAWLVAYGIGALVLLVSHPEIGKKAITDTWIVAIFCFGVVFQVIAALLYKYSMLYLYFGEEDSSFKETWRYKQADWISEQAWLELLFDVTTIGCFLVATCLTVCCLQSPGATKDQPRPAAHDTVTADMPGSDARSDETAQQEQSVHGQSEPPLKGRHTR